MIENDSVRWLAWFMKRFPSVVLGAFLATASIGFAAEGEPAHGATLSSLSFLVGGVWRGEGPAPVGKPRPLIESHFEWAGNHHAIRFESTWIIDGKPYPYTSGMYVWDPEKAQTVIVYSDAEGSLTTGTVEQVGEVFHHQLRVIDSPGKIDAVKTQLSHLSDHEFSNAIFISKGGTWEKLAEVDYTRGP